jgi:hypothetical protein
MIDTVANLLDAIAEREAKLIESAGIKHPPTIGGMYEALTAKVLGHALPTNQPLQVVSGFIRGADGKDSLEMDCMVVLGEVEDIPYSPKKRVPKLSQVVAVIQVKKAITSKDFEEGHNNIKSVRAIAPDLAYATVGQVERAFETIARTPLVKPLACLSPLQQTLVDLLHAQLNSPSCIVLGYYGYKGHRTFREGLSKYLQTTIGIPNCGPMSLPDVVLNSEVAAVKNIALPWSAPLHGDWWPVYMTARIKSPHAVLLEAIWTRLVFRGLLSGSVFGEDLDLEEWCMLAAMRFDSAKRGWVLRVHDDEAVPEAPVVPQQWSPVELSLPQCGLVTQLCKSPDGSIVIDDLSACDLIEADISYLNSHGLVGRDPRNAKVYRLLTQECRVVILSDGRFMAGDDNSGRLFRWVSEFDAARKAQSRASSADS